jgi:hypothetical protein
MDLVSLVIPAAPAMGPVLFDVPAQAPSLPLNVWALLLAPVPEPEPAEAATAAVTEVKVASPQQIAQAVIRSMLSPIMIHEDPAPDRPKDEEPPATPIEPGIPLAVAAQPQISLPITVPDPTDPEPRPMIAPDQRAPGLPQVVSATTKTAPKDPVAFELRLMPASNADSDRFDPKCDRADTSSSPREAESRADDPHGAAYSESGSSCRGSSCPSERTRAAGCEHTPAISA